MSGSQPTPQTLQARDLFVREWGRMSTSWGINRTMAQIHALLIGANEPMSMDEIKDKLVISRGNASMNLRELMDWGIVERYRAPGDRRDLYRSSGDILTIVSRVVRERKRREIDPTANAIAECLSLIPADDKSEQAEALRHRLEALQELFVLFDRIFTQAIGTDDAFKSTIGSLRTEDEPLKP
jgi:DNA-binding transcriptional regulator GbsR (MarR family)